MKIKVSTNTICRMFIAIIAMCGIGYAMIDKYQELMTLFVLTCFLVSSFKHRGVRMYSTINMHSVLIWIFCLLICVSYFYSFQPANTLKYAIQMLLISCICLFKFDVEYIEKTIKTISTISVLVAFTVIWSVAFPGFFKSCFSWYFTDKNAVFNMIDMGSGVGIIGHNAYAAGVSNLCVGYFFAKYFSYKRCSVTDWIVLCVGMVAVLATGKRILLLSIAITIACFFIISMRKEQKKKLMKSATIILLLAVILLIFVPVSRRMVIRIIEGLGDDTFNNRRIFWDQAIEMYNQKKAFGWGFGIFPYYDRYFGTGWGYSAHNQYYGVLAELGYVGTTAFLLMITYTLIITIRFIANKKAMANPRYSFIMIFSLYYQIWYIIYGFTGVPVSNYSQHFLYILLGVFTCSTIRGTKQKQAN